MSVKSRYLKGKRWLYVVRGGVQLCKVGWSNNPDKRARTVLWVSKGGRLVRLDITNEQPVVVWRKHYREDGVVAMEMCVKHLLRRFRRAGEWYDIEPARAIAAVETVDKKLRSRTIAAAGKFIANQDPWQ